jgi:hypothetical protein
MSNVPSSCQPVPRKRVDGDSNTCSSGVVIDFHAHEQPAPVHAEAEPRRSPLWPVILLASLAAVGVFVWWAHQDPPLPSPVATRLQVVAQVGQAAHTTVTAACTQTDDHDYTCRLRDAAGRYGYATVSYVVATHREHAVAWSFPVAADGTVTTSFDPSQDVRTAVYESLSETGAALGRPDLVNAITCHAYRCTAHSPVVAVTLSHNSSDHYGLTYRVAVP